ncbi:hypothetical protein C362_03108 [Cryptococcus neoformans Bt1]|nr:hypothetical protein C362_03108 [Cryptococcus neoformans var. grubii Bt1]
MEEPLLYGPRLSVRRTIVNSCPGM